MNEEALEKIESKWHETIPEFTYISLIKIDCQWCGNFIKDSRGTVKRYWFQGNICNDCNLNASRNAKKHYVENKKYIDFLKHVQAS